MAVPKHRADEERSPSGVTADWRSAYRIENAGVTEAFVERHPFLVPLLRHAPSAIERHFGEHGGLRLETVTDLGEEAFEHLYLYVRTDRAVDDAIERQRRLEEDWWLDAMLDARGEMTIGVEFT